MTPAARSQNITHQLSTPESRLLDLLRDGEPYTVEQVLEEAPDFTWVQLFVAMDNLSRSGMVELRREGFIYWLRKAESWSTLNGTPPHR